MEHKGTKTIETDRLILRKFCAEDINAAYANWTSDEKVTEFLRWRTRFSSAKHVIDKQIKNNKTKVFFFINILHIFD